MGKLKVVGYVKQMMEINDLKGVTYIEPFTEGVSVALSLLFDKYEGNVKINDKDWGISVFRHFVLNEPEILFRMISIC